MLHIFVMVAFHTCTKRFTGEPYENTALLGIRFRVYSSRPSVLFLFSQNPLKLETQPEQVRLTYFTFSR